MTQQEIYDYHTKMREQEAERVAIHTAKRKKLIKAFKQLGSYPLTQHPDYEQDVAFDIDDIIELLEKIEKDYK